MEVTVAKAIVSAAIFMRVEPKKGAQAAWDGYHGALGYVPPPIAIHYQLLTLEGRQPRGRPIDLAFKFPDYYNEEIAPDLVAYWEDALEKGKIPDDALTETREALAATRLKLRPLLLDKLRLLVRLSWELRWSKGARRAELERDLREVELELQRSFGKVARRPEVLDQKKRAYDRLRIQLEDMGLALTDDDRMLDPDRAAPQPKKIEAPPPPPPPDESALTEPARPPPPVLPPQPKPGEVPVIEARPLPDLVEAYANRIAQVVESWLGTPYRWGSATKKVGTDCSGFTQALFGECFELGLPRVSRDQYRVGASVAKNDLRPGDLLFFDIKDVGQISHVGVYAGNGKFAHASSSRGVVYDKLDSPYNLRAYRGARRILVYPG